MREWRGIEAVIRARLFLLAAAGLAAAGGCAALPERPVRPAARALLPKGLKAVAGAEYAPLEALAPGSREAQERQKKAAEELGLCF